LTIEAPKGLIPLDMILPDEPLLMMGAGPVPIPARVAQANSIVINHLGETMAKIIDQVKEMSRYVFQTKNSRILGVAGPGSAAMEMAIVNLVEPGSKVLSICNGFFSHRLSEMAERVDANVVRMQIREGKTADPEEVKEQIIKHKPDVITMVQGETSNTVLNRHIKEIAVIAKEYDCKVIVDAVCTLSTMPLEMDEWGIDAVITGGQKGLASIPGVSLVAFSVDSWKFINARADKIQHWCLDAKLANQFWYEKSYHYTAPVSGILAIHEALRLICTETLEKRFERHLRCSSALQSGIESMGLSLFTSPAARLNSVVGISLPIGVDSKKLLAHMSKTHRVEISGSFGLNIVRIGQMGEQCRSHHIFRALHALGASMYVMGAKVDIPSGVAALESTLDDYL
jgi:alanine-glyoxylate transaminase/serine-glyoxylate transaminase/serine-pyruvate transaminase